MAAREGKLPDVLAEAPAPSPDEVPKGFRLRRVGPGQWVAEPSAQQWRTAWLLVAVALVTCAVTIWAVRSYYRRKAQGVIVAVNGVPIRRDRVLALLADRYGVATVSSLVADELRRQFAVSRRCWPSEEQVEARFREESSRPGFLESLVRQGITERAYKERLRHRLAEISLIPQGVSVTPADIRYFYERNVDPHNPKAVFRTPERVQVTVIATVTREAAEKALVELMRNEPWSSVVTRFSVDRSREQAGLLDPFSRGQSVFADTPGVEAALFRLREGDRVGPLRAGGKWWIVRCLRKWPATVVPFEKARADAEMGARIEIGTLRNAARVAAERRDFVRRASIQVFDPAYDEVSRPVVSDPPG